MCPAPDRGGLAVPGDHAYALVDADGDVVDRATLQESDAIAATRRQDAVARRLHFRWVRLAGNRGIAERKAEVARTDLGKSQPRHRENRFAIGDAFGTFQLHAQKQFAVRIE